MSKRKGLVMKRGPANITEIGVHTNNVGLWPGTEVRVFTLDPPLELAESEALMSDGYEVWLEREGEQIDIRSVVTERKRHEWLRELGM